MTSPGSGTPPRPPRRPRWRLRFLVGAIVTAIVGAAMAGWLIARTSAPPSGPVVLISIDSLRADHVGAYGYRRAATPNLDALAADGVVFERAYSHSPLTVPAHLSILSGRLPFDTGARSDEGYVVPPKLLLLPGLLHRRGFKTAGIVSSPLLGRDTGLVAAFDFFDDDAPPRAAGTPPSAVHRDGEATLAVAERWVEQQGTRFFLFLHFDEPRAPYAPPPRFAGGDPYDGEVRHADELVGRLFAFLKAKDLYDRAVIVLLSDHGEALGEHGETGHGLLLHEATLRTPLFVKLPKNEGGGRRRTEVVQHVDVAATILDLMGAPRPSGVRGRSLRHLLASDDATIAPAPVYSETHYASLQYGWAELAAVTDGRYRFVAAPKPEMYDLTQDRAESENLATADPSKAAQLAAALEKLAPAAVQTPAKLAPEDRDLLIALAADGRLVPEGRLVAEGRPAAEGRLSPEARPGAAPVRGAGAAAPEAEAAPSEPADPIDPKDRLPILGKLRTADELAAGQRFAEAITIYRDVLSADPDIPVAWRQLGTLLLAVGQFKESLDAFREQIRLRPEDPAAIAGAARALGRLGRNDEAERVALVAAKLDPAGGNELLVRLELKQKDYAGARRAADAARAADPTSPLVALAEGVELLQSGKPEEALPRLEEAVQQAAAKPVQMADVRVYAGEALARLRRYSDAETRLLDELKWFPESVRAREALAGVYQATGRASEARASIAEIVKSSPTPEGYAAACRVSTAAGDRKGALSLRLEGRQRFGESAIRSAEAAPR